jgi:hypothetical protein
MNKILLATVLLSFTVLCDGQNGLSYDSYGGVISLKGNKTGWFHVEEIGGRWFFITPEGSAFFSLGATHAVECVKQDEQNLFQTRYQNDEEKLGRFLVSCFREWGYNSSGYGPLPSMEKMLPYVATIWTEGPRSFSAGAKSQNSDIFDPGVQERLKRTVRESSSHHRGNPYCLGYVFIDLPLWNVSPQSGISYVDFIRLLGPETYGKKEYVKFLKSQYENNLQKISETYNLSINSQDDIAVADMSKVSPKNSARIASDDEAFLVILAKTYYECITGELRKSDPDHLILGDRLTAASAGQPGLIVPDTILKTAAKYVDVISFQPMGTIVMHKDYIDHVFSITGKPVLFADVNTMLSRPVEGQANTEEYERNSGEHTLKYYLNIAESKFLIGIHRCTVRDFRPWDNRYYRRGLLKADDTPYPILVDYTRRTNNQVFEMVYGIKN